MPDAFKPGVAANNGKLYVFSNHRVQVLRGWPELAAWTKCKRRPCWIRFRPSIDLRKATVYEHKSGHRFLPSRYPLAALELGQHRLETDCTDEGWDDGEALEQPDEDTKRKRSELEAWGKARDERAAAVRREFFASVPKEVRSAVERFPARQWHLLVLAARCEGGLELIQSNPALAFCLASNWAFTGRPSGEAVCFMRRMIGRKRRLICERLGFPAGRQAAKVLAKIGHPACVLPWMLGLREKLRDRTVAKNITHLRVINVPVLSLVMSPALSRFVTPTLLWELGRLGPFAGHRSQQEPMMRDTLQMAEQLGEAHLLRPYSFTNEVAQVHDRLVRCLNKQLRTVAYRFPPPPIAGTDQIVPITTHQMLHEEGVEQSNCVASRAPRIAEGLAYVYRMIAPERATIQIGRQGRGWKLVEVKGPGNAEVGNGAMEAVAKWLARSPLAVPLEVEEPF